MKLDIVILTWNDGELLDIAVSSALVAGKPFDTRIVVVDNASSPPAEVDADPSITLVRNSENRGVAGGRNDGVAAGDAEFVCFLDSDAELEPDSLVRLFEPLLDDPRIGMTVPVFADQTPEASAGEAPTLGTKVRRVLDRVDTYSPVPRDHSERWWEVDFGIGACQLLRREMFDEVHGLDERLWWADDVDFCLRAKERGWRIVQVAGGDVIHPPRRRFRRAVSWKSLKHAWAVARLLTRHGRVGRYVRSVRGAS